ncbi:hypothetical protein [Pseudomonas mosselii]|uniref:hypothetical protein n=1 Tax=Pseudomonas mosselii TaxID=78327 RepID=UPI001F2EE86D|nr:hypothetical protein [Pseudomonas mosselii]
MDTNKMREQFEAQFVEEYVRVLGEGSRELAAHTLAANPPLVSMSWWAWQASREAVVIDLPSVTEVGGLCGMRYWTERQVITAVEAEGLRVAP